MSAANVLPRRRRALARARGAAHQAAASVLPRRGRTLAQARDTTDLGAITTRAPEASRADLLRLGIEPRGIDAIWRAVEAFFRTGFHPAISLCIRRHGEVILDRAIGHAEGTGPDDAPGAPRRLATPDTPYCLFSASKAITAVLIHHLDDQGLLHIDDRVADYLPEFACHGKETTTLRHVLTHRAGIPSIAGPEDVDRAALLLDWDQVVARLCAARPDWPPGRRLAYHAVTGGFILGEVVRRVTGKGIREVLAEQLLDPLGFAAMNYGLPPQQRARIARNAFTGRPAPFPFSRIVRRALGVPFREATRISNDPRWLEAVVPSGNICATANEASRFYQLLLNEGELDGVRVLDPRTVRRARTETAYLELDLTLGLPLRYGLGFMLGAPRLSLYGPGTPQAFGHMGFIENVTWADPQRQIAVALLNSGKPFLGAHLLRLRGVVAAIARHCPVVR